MNMNKPQCAEPFQKLFVDASGVAEKDLDCHPKVSPRAGSGDSGQGHPTASGGGSSKEVFDGFMLLR